jgi:hypothetical protein
MLPATVGVEGESLLMIGIVVERGSTPTLSFVF